MESPNAKGLRFARPYDRDWVGFGDMPVSALLYQQSTKAARQARG
ncbi:hypothetical protein [Agrobacterium bohemicum]|nr:hypothetical protein [Agrobacterium bohemicum]